MITGLQLALLAGALLGGGVALLVWTFAPVHPDPGTRSGVSHRTAASVTSRPPTSAAVRLPTVSGGGRSGPCPRLSGAGRSARSWRC